MYQITIARRFRWGCMVQTIRGLPFYNKSRYHLLHEEGPMVVYNYVELWEYNIIYNCPERLRTEAPINKMLSSVLSSPF
jgi:hypothetical protein